MRSKLLSYRWPEVSPVPRTGCKQFRMSESLPIGSSNTKAFVLVTWAVSWTPILDWQKFHQQPSQLHKRFMGDAMITYANRGSRDVLALQPNN